MKKAKSIEDTKLVFGRAIRKGCPVTITYTRVAGTVTVRTIEAYEIRETKTGNLIVKAMDRETGEARSWRLDRVNFYTVHRSAFRVPRPVVNMTAQSAYSKV